MKKKMLSIYEYWLDWKLGTKLISTILNVTVWSVVVLLIVSSVINAREVTETMGNQWLLLEDQVLLQASEKVTAEMRVLQTLAKTPSLVAAVKEINQSRSAWTANESTLYDQTWTNQDPNAEPLVKEILESPASRYLMDFQKDNPSQVEVFITDANGLNVAMTDRTSDFRQSDEDWWHSTFAQGKGGLYIGAVEYDDSSQKYAMDIGIPIKDPVTQEAVGVLRGSVNISAMIQALQSMSLGETGNVVLVDKHGIVLYSHQAEHFMKPVPDSIAALLQSNPRSWTQSVDMDGRPAIVAYSSFGNEMDASLGWRILFTQTLAEANQAYQKNILISSLACLLVVIAGMLISVFVIRRSIVAPIENLARLAHELSLGNVISEEDQTIIAGLKQRKDEIGEVSQAFERLILYFKGAAAAATSIVNKDLTIRVDANSERDVMGVAFAKMVTELNMVIAKVSQNARSVASAAAQLASASDQSGKATSQIAMTMQQVAAGTTQQSEEVAKTAKSVDQMNQGIQEVVRGVQDQSRAASQASAMATQISSAMQQVTTSAKAGAQGAGQAAEAAHSGGQTIQATIMGMQTLKSKVGLSAEKVQDMGQRSEQIDAIVETIDEIASQTDLLALNAAIEAARVESKSQTTVETILQHHMLGAASLLAQLLEEGYELQTHGLDKLACQAKVHDFFVSDSDGVIIASTNPASLGFRFSEDPRQQSSAFRSLLTQKDGIVIQPVQAREQDGKPFMFVGVSRRDCPGIIQAGMSADAVYALVGYSRGFGVVADEIRKLSIRAKTATKEIALLIRNIQKSVREAVTVMEDAAVDVENRSVQAVQAGESLGLILQTVETVHQQMEEIAQAIQRMDVSSRELVHAMETVNTVVEKNAAAGQEMAVNSNLVRNAMENVASISEENSAAVEEVSASTEEVLAQVEQVSAAASSLMDMAQSLQAVVSQFVLADSPHHNADASAHR